MKIIDILSLIRKEMNDDGIDVYLLDDADFHSSEYVNSYFKARSFASGFCGSNGKLVIAKDKAYLFTDGRYFLEASQVLKDTTIDLMKMGEPGVPTLTELLCETYKGKVIGLDGRLFPYNFVSKLSESCKVIDSCKIIDKVWTKDSLKFNPVYSLSIDLVGETTKEKIARIRHSLKEDGATSMIATSLDDISYTLNLRGSDVVATPVFFAFLYVSMSSCKVFLNKESLDQESKERLSKDGVKVCDYFSFDSFISTLKDESILCNLNRLNYSYLKLIEKGNKIIAKELPTLLMKACKNSVEINNNKAIHLEDGAAVFRFMKYVKEKGPSIDTDELSLCEVLENYRKMSKRYNGISFETIMAFKENGAVIHYEPTKEKFSKVKGRGMLLVDSGGQYSGGTTDITRTFIIGEATKEEKTNYTLVLKSHFVPYLLKITKDMSCGVIDDLSRKALGGQDFNHGLGHGVGYMGCVHEEPNRFKRTDLSCDTSFKLLPGMTTTVEPGLYFEGKYGIRIENESLSIQENDYIKLENYTYCPYDRDLIDTSMLSKEEISWFNKYNKECIEKLSPLLANDEITYLKEICREI